MPKPATYVALLRGINVGGKNKLPMKDLVALCTESGCGDVRSHIQSGNVLFTAAPALATRLATDITRRIERAFGFRTPVVLRSAAELTAVARGNPFLAEGTDPDLLHVAFLADRPSKAQIGALDPLRSPPDRFAVRGRDVYLALPNGVARSKLTNAYLDGKLGTISTLRNWRTVLKLIELARE
jgi:uncharacterized protein (DUF1697 family)